MPRFVCATCGVQYADTDRPPAECPVCEDARQYVPEGGQRWTTLEELRTDHRTEVRDERELTGIGTEPAFAIGQRALLVPYGERSLMWDCITLLDDAAAETVERRGGLAAIAVSHPHYYSSMVEWAHRFECPVLPARRRPPVDHAARPRRSSCGRASAASSDDGLTLIRCGGHFAGRHGAALGRRRGRRGRAALRRHRPGHPRPPARRVHVQLPEPDPAAGSGPSTAIADALEPFAFEHVYGAWWGRFISDGKGAVRRSAERYGRALAGDD